MKTTIYKVTCTKAYQMCEQGSGFSLGGWGSNTSYYEGDDDGGKEYELPANVETGETQDGCAALFEKIPGARALSIMPHQSGRPQLVGLRDHSMPVLSLAPCSTHEN